MSGQLPGSGQTESIVLSPEEQLAQLHDEVKELLLAGGLVAVQLKLHGDHQTNFYGHFTERCRTCVVGTAYDKAAETIGRTLAAFFPEPENTDHLSDTE